MLISREISKTQRLAFGDLGIQFVYKVKKITKPQAFNLTYQLMAFYERSIIGEKRTVSSNSKYSRLH